MNLSRFLEIDHEVSKSLPSSFLDGSHLYLLLALTHSGLTHAENYKSFEEANEIKLLSYLLENKDIEINVENIKKMYGVLSSENDAFFRSENVQIVSGEKFYVPTSPEKIEVEMQRLCERFNHLNHPKPEDFDDIFKFVLRFICIHPFPNGNGRLSAFLVELLMVKFGLESALHLPFDALLNGIYIHRTTQEIRKASGFFYDMKEYEYGSYIAYMKELLMKSYALLLQTSKQAKLLGTSH